MFSDLDRVGGGMIMTEFGAAEDIKGDMYALEKSMQQADKHAQSWMYWQFKYYQDITTCTPEGESMYQADGSVCQHKLQILSRTYPQAVAGTLGSYSFHPLSARFELTYNLVDAQVANAAPGNDAKTSIVYINRELYYPHGANVAVTYEDGSAADVTVSCLHTSNLIKITQSASAVAGSLVKVAVAACHPVVSTDCTCR